VRAGARARAHVTHGHRPGRTARSGPAKGRPAGPAGPRAAHGPHTRKSRMRYRDGISHLGVSRYPECDIPNAAHGRACCLVLPMALDRLRSDLADLSRQQFRQAPSSPIDSGTGPFLPYRQRNRPLPPQSTSLCLSFRRPPSPRWKRGPVCGPGICGRRRDAARHRAAQGLRNGRNRHSATEARMRAGSRVDRSRVDTGCEHATRGTGNVQGCSRSSCLRMQGADGGAGLRRYPTARGHDKAA
jgi:hypothetical protein